jgi:hypothetical protein
MYLDGYANETAIRRPGISTEEAVRLRRIQVEDSINTTTRYWFSEIFCDLAAARLVGPAFLAAVDRLIPTSADSPSVSHPPISLRRSLVRQYLEGHIPHLFLDSIWQDVLKSVTTRGSVELPWIICKEVLEQGAAAIELLVNSVVKLSPFEWMADLPDFLKRVDESFKYLSPPSAELTMQGSKEDVNYFWLLMFAAWRFRLSEEKFKAFRLTYNWSEEKAEEALSNLLLHSLQSIELRSRWLQKHDPRLLSTSKAAQP